MKKQNVQEVLSALIIEIAEEFGVTIEEAEEMVSESLQSDPTYSTIYEDIVWQMKRGVV